MLLVTLQGPPPPEQKPGLELQAQAGQPEGSRRVPQDQSTQGLAGKVKKQHKPLTS